MTYGFKEDAIIEDINITSGSNIFAMIPNENKLMVACNDGFKFISIKEKIKKFKSVHCIYKVLCLDIIDENTIICCCSEKNKNIIKQFIPYLIFF